MEIFVADTIIKYNTHITLININNIKYEYITQNNIKYIKSNEQSEDIINNINIILSNLKTNNIQDIISCIIKYINCNEEINEHPIDDKYYIFHTDTNYKHKLNKHILWNNFNSNTQTNFLKLLSDNNFFCCSSLKGNNKFNACEVILFILLFL